MMTQLALPLAIFIGISCYLIIILLLPKELLRAKTQHLKLAMQRLEEQQKRLHSARPSNPAESANKLSEDNVLVRALLVLPGSEHIISFVEDAGLINRLDRLVLVVFVMLVILSVLLAGFGVLGIFVAIIITFTLVYMFLKSRIKKRRQLFINMLPDALDIIVRSVKAGYPINAAIGMVADSLPPEIGAEYLRIMHEASYGYSLGEAVTRFAERMKESDVSFFAVVVNLQQETGGNLAEVLGNLSDVIRQRQQLKLKVRALSAEGRMTVVILVGIACFMVITVNLMAPGHFDRLFTTSAGNTVMTAVGSAFALAFIVIRKIINFRV